MYRQGADRDGLLYAGAGLGACNQWDCVAHQLCPGLDLARFGFLIYLLNAILRCVIGYLLIRHPDAGAEGVTMVLAALFIVGGLFRVVGASAVQFPRWGWTVFSVLVAIALGVYLLATWRSAGTHFIVIAICVDLILDGGSLVGFAGAIHSLPETHIGEHGYRSPP